MGKRAPAHKRPTAEEAALAAQVFQPSQHAHHHKRKQDGKKKKEPALQTAWVDEDDEDVEVNIEEQSRLRKLRKTEKDVQIDGSELQKRLKAQFTATHGSLAWANPENFLNNERLGGVDSDSDDGEELELSERLLRSTGSMLEKSSGLLGQGTLDICRVKDANQHAPSNAVIQAVNFHPNGKLMLTAGLDKTLHLFQVDGTTNAKVENIFVKELPILDAKFTLAGARAVLTGPRSYFYSYDLEAGKVTKIPGIVGRKERKLEKFVASSSGDQLVFLGSDGYLSAVSSKSYEWIGNMKMNGDVKSAAFCDNDRYLLSTGSDGHVYKWDMRTRKCVFVHADEGSLGNFAVAASSNGKYYATGSKSGVVNVYESASLSAPAAPKKALMHLTTRVDNLKFNSDSQILAMASKDDKDALKLVHLPSFTVFSNWPTSRTPLHCVSAMDFSPSSGYFAVGNARGRVLLYRLTHYRST